MVKVLGRARGLLIIVLLYGLINGGLWAFWSIDHSKEHEEYTSLNSWLESNKPKLDDLKTKAANAQTQDEYDEIKNEYTDLKGQYNDKVDEYNNVVKVLNNEFYLIPLPGKHGE